MKKNTVLIFYGLFSDDQNYDWIPYGPLYLYAILKQNGFNPIVLHEYENRNYEKIIEEYKDDLLCFGISAMTGFQIHSGIRAIKKMKEIASGDISAVVKGAVAKSLGHECLSDEYITGIGVGKTPSLAALPSVAEQVNSLDVRLYGKGRAEGYLSVKFKDDKSWESLMKAACGECVAFNGKYLVSDVDKLWLVLEDVRERKAHEKYQREKQRQEKKARRPPHRSDPTRRPDGRLDLLHKVPPHTRERSDLPNRKHHQSEQPPSRHHSHGGWRSHSRLSPVASSPQPGNGAPGGSRFRRRRPSDIPLSFL